MWGCFAGETRKTPPHFSLATRNPKEPKYLPLQDAAILTHSDRSYSHFGEGKDPNHKKWTKDKATH